MGLSLGIRIEGAHTPQGGRASISEMFWEKVRPAKRAAVRMKSCMVFVCVGDDGIGVRVDWLVRCERLKRGVDGVRREERKMR